MKKALIIANTSGFISRFLKNDLEILIGKGYTVECACNTKYPDFDTNSFFKRYRTNVYHVDFPIRNLDLYLILKSYRMTKKLLKQETYELIHCHTPIVAVILRQCARYYKKDITKIVYTSHGFPFYKGNAGVKAKLFFYIEKYYSKYTDAILTINCEDYNNAKRMACKNVFLMHGVGVDTDFFQCCNIDRKDYRKKLGFLDEDEVILSIGELNTNKNHAVVIKALKKINNPHIVYAICGREVTEKGKKNELADLAANLNVRVLFLGFRRDIPAVCHCAEIGAIPSFKEGLGLAGIEMLASGIPVTGSNRQGILDYVQDGNTGYLADPNDSGAFAEAILKTFELSKDERTKENCYQMAKKFNSEQAYEVIKSVYDSLLFREVDNE